MGEKSLLDKRGCEGQDNNGKVKMGGCSKVHDNKHQWMKNRNDRRVRLVDKGIKTECKR